MNRSKVKKLINGFQALNFNKKPVFLGFKTKTTDSIRNANLFRNLLRWYIFHSFYQVVARNLRSHLHFQIEKWVKKLLAWEIERVPTLAYYESMLWSTIPTARRVTLMTRADVFSIFVNLSDCCHIVKKLLMTRPWVFFCLSVCYSVTFKRNLVKKILSYTERMFLQILN